MFRSDRDALAGKVDDLRTDNERLRVENEAMRADLLARRAVDPVVRPNLYRGGDRAISAGERAALAKHDLQAFPVWATAVLHVLTLGVFSFFHFNAMHERLPKGERDDPSAFKAIALHFVPYFNFYWVFFSALRLNDRVNMQLRLRGEEDRASRTAVIVACVLSVIPYLNFLTAPIAWIAVAISMQRAVNRIVEIDQQGASAHADVSRVRIPAVSELAGPDEALAMAEEEASAAEAAAARRAL